MLDLLNWLDPKTSDCCSARRGGDLGPFGRGQMQRKVKFTHNFNLLEPLVLLTGAFEKAT